MGRIDIVVFPNGGREVFGQIKSEPPVSAAVLAAEVAAYAGGLPPADAPRKFTGYYDAADASDIAWSVYDENNPIVMVPMEPKLEEAEYGPVEAAFQSMELAQVPAEMRETLI